jgi:hypothetical protein
VQAKLAKKNRLRNTPQPGLSHQKALVTLLLAQQPAYLQASVQQAFLPFSLSFSSFWYLFSACQHLPVLHLFCPR